MKKKNNRLLISFLIVLASLLISCSNLEQQRGIIRTELQRHDLKVPGREAVQVRIEFDTGTKFGRHSHPGEEIIYVLEGLLEYKVGDNPAVTIEQGAVLFIPAGTVHSAKNIGSVKAVELATYIVEKSKPLVVITN